VLRAAEYTDTVEAPCPPLVSSAKGDKIDPVAAQMAAYLVALLRVLCAGEDVVAGIVILWARLVAKGSPVGQLLVGDP
jgi:hypothetical protein